jgi:hypothetical protein
MGYHEKRLTGFFFQITATIKLIFYQIDSNYGNSKNRVGRKIQVLLALTEAL